MPQVFKVGGYLVYFGLNEGNPLEPVHVHISEGTPTPYGTKVWITKSGRALLSYGETKISLRQLRILLSVIEARHDEIEKLWKAKFGMISY